MNKDYIIRNERKSEYTQVENLVREAFWNIYRPGCMEHYSCIACETTLHLSMNWILLWRSEDS